jgi:two-component sensor histidine kinase
MKRLYFRKKYVLLGILFGASFWVIDTVIDVTIFNADHTFIGQIIHPEPAEMWMRMVVLALFVLFSLYIGHAIEVRKRNEAELKATIDEKELLLKEIHHRVKNNMSLVSSLLVLQSDYVKNNLDRLLFEESCNRIKSMALIHDKLYQSSDFINIDFKDYIELLSAELFSTYTVNRNEIELKVDIDDVSISIDNAIPCGLIINELVTNALKYAFVGGKKGEIFIGLKKADGNKTRLTVSDNGAGPSRKFNINNPDSIGILIVKSLVEQLEADMKIDIKDGVKFEIVF